MLGSFKFLSYLCGRNKMMIMKSKEYYISLILSHAEELKRTSSKVIAPFGSVSRNEQKEGSDVDICVDMEPKMFLVVRLKRF